MLTPPRATRHRPLAVDLSPTALALGIAIFFLVTDRVSGGVAMGMIGVAALVTCLRRRRFTRPS